MRCSGPE